ncbi:hypothetical protein GCM10010468_68530 [Actinocorallia longicatena]|uniref:Uncharacterized protein n=1 Tax=Actinocorallia longicatena TaxID=111803 RepID=A0ABP6QN53_9ACTN
MVRSTVRGSIQVSSATAAPSSAATGPAARAAGAVTAPEATVPATIVEIASSQLVPALRMRAPFPLRPERLRNYAPRSSPAYVRNGYAMGARL